MVIGVYNNKGGVGKSFISSHLAMMLAYYKHKVSLIDMDNQGDAMKWVGGQASPGVWKWDGEMERMTSRGVDLIWGVHPKYEDAPPGIPEGYEYVIVDCRPELTVMEQVIDFFDLLIMPVKGRFSWDSAIQVKKIMEVCRVGMPVYILKNEALPHRMVASREETSQMEAMGLKVFEWGFPRDTKVVSAEMSGIPVWEVPYGSGGVMIGVFKAVCSEILHLDTLPGSRGSMRRRLVEASGVR